MFITVSYCHETRKLVFIGVDPVIAEKEGYSIADFGKKLKFKKITKKQGSPADLGSVDESMWNHGAGWNDITFENTIGTMETTSPEQDVTLVRVQRNEAHEITINQKEKNGEWVSYVPQSEKCSLGLSDNQKDLILVNKNKSDRCSIITEDLWDEYGWTAIYFR